MEISKIIKISVARPHRKYFDKNGKLGEIKKQNKKIRKKLKSKWGCNGHG